MMGFTLLAARTLGLLEGKPGLNAYLERLTERPAFERSVAKLLLRVLSKIKRMCPAKFLKVCVLLLLALLSCVKACWCLLRNGKNQVLRSIPIPTPGRVVLLGSRASGYLC